MLMKNIILTGKQITSQFYHEREILNIINSFVG